jgi:hypothetical protein
MRFFVRGKAPRAIAFSRLPRHRPYFYPSFLRQQESMQPSENPEKLDSCLRRNDGGWEKHGAVLWLSAAPGQMRLP